MSEGLPALAASRTSGVLAASPSPLDPHGAAAQEIALLWWIVLALLGAVTVAVLALAALALVGGRRRGDAGTRLERRLVVLGGIALPAAVAVVLTVLNVGFARSLTGWSGRPAGLPASAREPEVEVIAHQFWWEVRYLDGGFATANEIHLPVGRPVTLRMRSRDVIHSFWVPQLHGKIDLTPGHDTYLVVEAERAGVYRGQCAEFCGVQHALMGVLVVAEPERDFARWLARQRRPATPPADERAAAGLRVFLDAGCAACHTLRGTPADGDLGPDLTHLGSRLTLGAATVPNTRGNLGGWIVDSQSIKPGNRMPPMPLGSDELLALLDYLEGLE